MPHRLLPALALVGLLPACTGVRYYHQAIAGHLEITRLKRPIVEVLADTESPDKVKAKLRTIQRILDFAENEMQLPAGGNYTEYADLQRPHVVWNVFAAPEFSLKPRRWRYPVVGKLAYRGFYAKADADALAAKLRGEGYDVLVGGVDAYSTLGWFRDPVLNTFIDDKELDLVALVCHELAHRRLFVRGDSEFSESFAVTVEREAQRRWLRDDAKLARLRTRREQFRHLLFSSRDQLKQLYAERGGTPERMRERKERIFTDLRAGYARLKKSWGGYAGFDKWFKKPINNARFSSLGTYYQRVPEFERLLRDCDHDLPLFYERAKELAKHRHPGARASGPTVSETSRGP